MILIFPNYKQPDSKDCGPTCLKIIAKYYKKNIPIQQLRNLSETVRDGSSMLGLSEAAEKIGFRVLGVKLSFEKLQEVPLPCILHWNKNHFVVLYQISKTKKPFFKKSTNTTNFVSPPLEGHRTEHFDYAQHRRAEVIKGRKIAKLKISDPAHGLIEYTQEEFIKAWIGNNATTETQEGIALLLEPTPKFYEENTSPPLEGRHTEHFDYAQQRHAEVIMGRLPSSPPIPYIE